MTTPLSGTSSTTPTAPGPAKGSDSAMGPDAFMKLLVAQLKYQNPMAPTDGQAYMTQMATFTQVEKLDQLVKAQSQAVQWQQRVSAEGLLGRTVTGTQDGVSTTASVVGVRYGTDGGVLLELDGGRTMAASVVERVQTPAPAGSTAPAGTAPSSTTSGSTAPSSTTSGSTTPSSTSTSTEPSTTSTPSA